MRLASSSTHQSQKLQCFLSAIYSRDCHRRRSRRVPSEQARACEQKGGNLAQRTASTSVLGAPKKPCDHRPVDRAIVHGEDMDLPVCSSSATGLRSPRRRHVNQRPHPRDSTEQEGRKKIMESRTEEAQVTRTAYVQVLNDTVYKKERKKKNRRSIDQERIKSRKSPPGHQIPAPKNPKAHCAQSPLPAPKSHPPLSTTNLPPLAPRGPTSISRDLHPISSPPLAS